jgi:hypothetical protein
MALKLVPIPWRHHNLDRLRVKKPENTLQSRYWHIFGGGKYAEKPLQKHHLSDEHYFAIFLLDC